MMKSEEVAYQLMESIVENLDSHRDLDLSTS